MKKLLLLILLFIATPAYALDCYIASDVIPFDAYYHDDTGTLTTPTNIAAANNAVLLRITPFTGTAIYCNNTGGSATVCATTSGNLPAMAQLNSETGRYGGEYTVGATPTTGTYEITMKGTVATAKNVGKVVKTFQVRSSCITSGTITANVTQWNGTNVATPATAGIPDVNAKNINNVATTSVTTINPNLGTTQPVNFTGTATTAYVKSDTIDVGGTVQTARDLGASVLLSSGTGTGQISLSSGAVLLQPTQTGVTIPTVTTVTGAVTVSSINNNVITTLSIADGAITPAKEYIIADTETTGVGNVSTTLKVYTALGVASARTYNNMCLYSASNGERSRIMSTGNGFFNVRGFSVAPVDTTVLRIYADGCL